MQWRIVSSGVPQRLILVLLLFNLFVNDIVSGCTAGWQRFADDFKSFSMVRTKTVCENLQKDLSKLGEQATVW